MKNYDIIIIGAGIVGLSVALELINNQNDLSICLLEKEDTIAKHQTGNNSGVIHSGVYYKPGSRKAINCVEGYYKLLEFCKKHNIKYDLCGKIIVATDESEESQIRTIYDRGIKNGLKNLEIIDRDGIKKIEPYCNGTLAIHVPQAGIINYTEVCKTIKKLLSDKGVDIVFNCKVDTINVLSDNSIEVKNDNQVRFASKLINCCGLYSDKMFEQSTKKKASYQILPFRGEYYKLKKGAEKLVNGLIYPVPNPEFPFLGVHFTKMISGGVESGPNAVLAFAREGYKKNNINLKELYETLSYKGFHNIVYRYWKDGFYEMYRSFIKAAFVRDMQKLIPTIKASDVVRGGAGVRAQAVYPNGDMIDDFLIEFDGPVVNVCNAPSPAATSSFSIARTIAKSVLNT